MERGTRKKHYAIKTMDIFSFMARMMFFLPDKHRKILRYYGLYAHNIDKKLEEVDRNTWSKAVEHSFEKNPEICPHCSTFMIRDVIFSFQADREIKILLKIHGVKKGYFIPYKGLRPP